MDNLLKARYFNRLKTFGPIVVAAVFTVCTMTFIHWIGASRQIIEDGIDLRKGWRVCSNSNASRNEVCKTGTIELPNRLKFHSSIKNESSAAYENEFRTPTECFNNKISNCVFYIGGVYQGVEVVLNGTSLGKNFSRSDFIPASFRLPHSLLKADGTSNKVLISIYSESKLYFPAVTQGPIGIMSSKDSNLVTFGIIGERIILPIISASITLTLALIGLFWKLSKNSSNNIITHYVLFCLAATIYLVNTTRIPREFLGVSTGIALNFALRYLIDFLIFRLILEFFSVKNHLKSIATWIYIIAIFIFMVIFIFSMFNSKIDDAFSKTYFESSSLPGLRQNRIIYFLAYVFSPITLIGSLIGFQQVLKHHLKFSGSTILLLLFITIVPIQIADIFTLIGIFRIDHEIYYMRLYMPFIGLAFGYAIWTRWLEKESSAEATLRIGEITQGVAHDLRSPIAVLNLVVKTSTSLANEERDLLSQAIIRIEKISLKVLELYKASTTDSIQLISKSDLEFFSITKVISEIIENKNHILSHHHKPKIELELNQSNAGNLYSYINIIDISRSLENILNNAIDATAGVQESKILVRWPCCTI